MQNSQQDNGQNQSYLIATYNQYAAANPDAKPLDINGVCAALSLAFCHSRLIESKNDFELYVFDKFITGFQSQEGIGLFFKELEALTLAYQEAKNEHKDALLNDLQGYWSVLAILNLAVSMYAQKEESHAIGVSATPTELTLSYAGLAAIGGSTFIIPPGLFQEIFFSKNISDGPAVLSPLAPGGTYFVQLPQHICAVHVSLDGELTYYDPNCATYLSNKKDIEEYIKHFEPFNCFERIPIKITAVRLVQKDLEKDWVEQSVPQIKKNLVKASQYNISQKQKFLHEPSKSLQLEVIQHIAEAGTSDVEDLFKKIILRAELSDFQAILTRILQGYYGQEHFVFLDILLQDTRLFIWELQHEELLTKALAYENLSVLLYMLKKAPETLSFSEPFREVILGHLKKHLNIGQKERVTQIINTIFDQQLFAPTMSSTLKIFIDNAFDNTSVAELAIEVWQKITRGNQVVFLDRQSLLFYAFNMRLSEQTLVDILSSERYCCDSEDVLPILSSGYLRLKKVLEHKAKKGLVDQHPPSQLMFAATYGRVSELVVILKNQGVSHNELCDCLVIAASNGHTQMCMMLMAYHSVMPRQQAFHLAILLAAQNGHKKTLQLLLDALPKDLVQKKVEEAFKVAILEGKVDIVSWLKKKYNIRRQIAKKYFFSYCYQAIQKGRESVIKAFIVAGIKHLDLDVLIEHGNMPAILAAVVWNKNSIAELLLKAGAKVNIHRDFEQPLAIAAKMNKKMTEMLLAYGALLDYRNEQNQTPLMHAVIYNRLDIVNLLLAYQPNISLVDKNGQTPLHIAISHGFSNIALRLIAAKPELEIENAQGWTPLVLAAKTKNKKVFFVLLNQGAQLPNIRYLIKTLSNTGLSQESLTDWINTIVVIALERGRLDILQALIRDNVCIDRDGLQYARSLMSVVYHGESRVLDLFIQLVQPNINLNLFYDDLGDTLLTIAVDQQDIKTVLILLKGGACINTPNSMGQTPVYRAVSSGDINMVKTLVAHGADINIPDMCGITPLILALELSQISIACELLKVGAPIMSIQEVSEIFMISGASTQERDSFYEQVLNIGLEYGYAHLIDFFIKGEVTIHFNLERHAVQSAIFNNHTHVLMLYLDHVQNKQVLIKQKNDLISLAMTSPHQHIAGLISEKIQKMECNMMSHQRAVQSREVDEQLLEVTFVITPFIASQDSVCHANNFKRKKPNIES